MAVCRYKNCKTRPYYGHKNDKKGIFCSVHRMPGMIRLNVQTCKVQDCDVSPSFNFHGETKKRFCTEHKLPGMVIVQKYKYCCEAEGCNLKPSFNLKGQRRGKFCAAHKQIGMENVNVKNQLCKHGLCNTIASFNFFGEMYSIFCKKHCKKDMVNVKGKCKIRGCDQGARYNFEGHYNPLFCSKHKSEGMININHFIAMNNPQLSTSRKQNEVPPWMIESGQSSYQTGVNGETDTNEGKLVRKEKTKGKIIGIVESSKTGLKFRKERQRGTDGEQNSRHPIFCKTHCMKDMVNAKGKRGCGQGDRYNFEGHHNPEFCNKHKLGGMINVKRFIAIYDPGLSTSREQNEVSQQMSGQSSYQTDVDAEIDDNEGKPVRKKQTSKKINGKVESSNTGPKFLKEDGEQSLPCAERSKCWMQGTLINPNLIINEIRIGRPSPNQEKSSMCKPLLSSASQSTISSCCAEDGCFEDPCYGQVDSEPFLCAYHAKRYNMNRYTNEPVLIFLRQPLVLRIP